MRAVRFDHYGGVDVLEVRDVDGPVAGPGEVLVGVKATGINPGEIAIREGRLAERWPASFPSGQGSDFAGVIQARGEKAENVSDGDEVLGWTDQRASQAELVVVSAGQVTPKPANVPWEVAGSLFVAGMAAYSSVDAVAPRAGETVAVSAAAGGVGSIAVQLCRLTGATVIGLAGEANHEWLEQHGIVPATYGQGQEQRIREAAHGTVNAFIDTFGGGYVEMAIQMGVPRDRINTIADFEAVSRFGVKSQGTQSEPTAERLAHLVQLVSEGGLEVPIARTYSLDQVREAYTELAERHTHGKIVLLT